LEYKKLVLFGAGKIGRSFIAQLFSRSGYEVVFIDIDERIISELNKKKKYKVVIKSDQGDELIWVENVRGILGSDTDEIVREISGADIMAISVGRDAIAKICPLISAGIEARYQIHPSFPLDIILAENIRDASKVLNKEIKKHISNSIELESYLGLIETSIGKMVPIMPLEEAKKDILLVYAEPYNTLILDKKAFKNPIPEVAGLAPKDNIAAWVDRKSFIHNLGHAAAAYYACMKFPELKFLYHAMDKNDVYETTRATMLEAAAILMKHYPSEFSKTELAEHIDDLLGRFSNKALGDTIYRVGQDLYRKLGPDDRLAGALHLALKYRMPYGRILFIIACATRFNAVNEQKEHSKSDLNFHKEAELGISHILNSVCKIDPDVYPQVHMEAKEIVI